MYKECKGCSSINICNAEVKPGSIRCRINRPSSGQTEQAFKLRFGGKKYMGEIRNFSEIKEKARRSKYADIMVRATMMGLMEESEDVDRMMDIESADKKFNLRLDDWLKADDFNFAHDFLGIRDSIDRSKGFPATDFGFFVPRFAG